MEHAASAGMQAFEAVGFHPTDAVLLHDANLTVAGLAELTELDLVDLKASFGAKIALRRYKKASDGPALLSLTSTTTPTSTPVSAGVVGNTTVLGTPTPPGQDTPPLLNVEALAKCNTILQGALHQWNHEDHTAKETGEVIWDGKYYIHCFLCYATRLWRTSRTSQILRITS
jgi:hypothetical protein